MKAFPDYKTVNIDLLIPYARNSRTHSEEQIAKIAESIKEFGFLNPVIVGKDNDIIAGHGRVMAAKKAGLKELPIIEANHLTDVQRRAYVIADNRLALDSGWNNELLRLEISEIANLNFDVDLLGFNEKEFSVLFDDFKDVAIDDEIEHENKKKIFIECEYDDLLGIIDFLNEKLLEKFNIKIGILDE